MSADAQQVRLIALQVLFDYLLARLRERLTGGTVHFPALELPDDGSPLTKFVSDFEPTVPELLVLGLVLLPHIRPGALDDLLRSTTPDGGEFPAFGGIRGKQYRGIIPTAETAMFFLAGREVGARTQVQGLLARAGRLRGEGLIALGDVPPGEPASSGVLTPATHWLATILGRPEPLPEFSSDFPARLVTTQLEWDDLILPMDTAREVEGLRDHLLVQSRLWELPKLSRHLRRGYRILFSGPPGTGKTLTAGLLGKQLNRPVFRVDLSAVVSKYIGETEKNLSALFARAERRDWILFFDEADALFGSRSEMRSSNDRYANQEVSYLLQRIEAYDGIAVLATNFRDNLDTAFSRRFETVIAFKPPGPEERLRFWQQLLPAELPRCEQLDLEHIAERYELSGSQIVGAVRFAVTEWLSRNDQKLEIEGLLEGIKREYGKVGRMFNG